MIEEKLKKVTTERAPVAGGAGGVFPTAAAQTLLHDLRSGARSANEIHQLLQMAQRNAGAAPATPAAAGSGSGAAAAAGVLTAIDEDGEGDEEAKVPEDFDYFTDAADEDD